MEQKSNKGLIIVLVMFIIICLGLIGYIAYDNGMLAKIMNKSDVKEEKKESVKKEEAKELDINSRLVQSLYNQVSKENEKPTWYAFWEYNDAENFDIASTTDLVKMQLVGKNIKESNKVSINCNDYNILDTVADGSYSACFTQKEGTPYYNPNTIIEYGYSKKYIEMVYQDLFGNEYNVDTSIPIYLDTYKGKSLQYNQEADMYIFYMMETGGAAGPGGYTTKLSQAVKDDKEIKIYEIVEKYDEIENSSNNEVKVSETFTNVYTFKLDSDGMYFYVSKVKEA